MDSAALTRVSAHEWRLPQTGDMRAPAILYASEALLRDMEVGVASQLAGVAALPGVVRAVCAMPDAHTGFGFPIGAVAAMDPRSGVVSCGGVGFDIACGVRCHLTPLDEEDIRPRAERLADMLYAAAPSGVGAGGPFRLADAELDAMLLGGARWAVRQGHGVAADLRRIEDGGAMADAGPDDVSREARKRQLDQLGTLGSGNHYLEVQVVDAILDPELADAFGLRAGQVAVSIHCGSRGLGHQVATDYNREMLARLAGNGLSLADRELACAPIGSELGRRYLRAMRAAANCALANRQAIGEQVRRAFRATISPALDMPLLCDVSHNLCREETHLVDGSRRRLFVHRKGATRALPPGDPALDPAIRHAGQPLLVGGSMGSASYVLAGVEGAGELSFHSACHGAGRRMSRGDARKRFRGKDIASGLGGQGIVIRAGSWPGLAEEAPGAYKDVDEVIRVTVAAGLAKAVARLRPIISIKG